ncbi:MAG: farnesyl diphosphate synthase [Lactimicrobium sp.]|uniref:polyprenyl synthetase family protein n=1 Tax=Lactimicrobium sp. TaxID=2563780 RepID=UPI002F36119A
MSESFFDDVLNSYMDALPASRVQEAMRYSLLAGGKRIRPRLLFATAKGYDVPEKDATAFAAALEMIHTYSLIHDDLPAMDNDDLRRGRPTCHKQFDEATAILAGDGLLTYAFEVAAGAPVSAEKVQRSIAILAKMAGPAGMVLGQCLDTEETVDQPDWEALQNIHHKKTGCLLSAPLMIGAVLAGESEEVVASWHDLGDEMGLAFQIQDDIFDVELTSAQLGKSNSDARNDKVTSVTLLGIDKAKEVMNMLYDDSCKRAAQFKGFDAKELITLIHSVQKRNK